jgi:Tfp pilus assembly protein PilF
MPLALRTVVFLALALALGCAGRQRQHDTLARAGQEMRVELAQTYVDKGARAAAVPLLRRALAEHPDDPRVAALYATVLRDLGLYLQAEAQFRRVLALAPDYAPAHAGLAILCDLLRQPERARRHHERAVALAPGHAGYRNNLGFSLYLAGATGAAIGHYEAALALDPGLAITYRNLGFAYGRLGQLDAAERSFRTVDCRAEALLNLALVHDERGDADRADALRAQAYALTPDLRPAQSE